jgi:DNA-directed RNA polymerase specialized sigma24 family protein
MKSSWKRLPLMSGDARAWLPQIVRNTCYTWLEKNRPLELSLEFDERFHLPTCDTPETIKIAGGGRRSLVLALETLPPRFCDTAKEGFSLLKPGLLHLRGGHAGAVLVCERN